MSPKLNHENLGSVQKTAYLTATITTVDSEFDTACFGESGKCPAGTDIPIFYHCQYEEGEEPAQRNNGALEGAAGAFSEDDEVIVQCEIIGANQYKVLRVIGFTDKPKVCATETVYVVMKVGDTQRCFVWKIEDGEYAAVNKNDGDPASFPCDPVDISNWVDNQESVGETLPWAKKCGRKLLDYGELPACVCGDWGTAGGTSDSKEELSDCESCNFIDTAECSISWNLTSRCEWVPGHWRNAGTVLGHLEQHILWGYDSGWPPVHYGSKYLTFQNNSEAKAGLIIEIQSEEDTNEYASSGCSCSGVPCDNLRLDSKVITRLYKFHTPIAENIFQITFTETGSCNGCADTGVRTQENYVVPTMQLKLYGAYSEKIIVQAYFVEVRTVTRSANCNFVYGTCFGSGCVGNGCPWAEQVFTCQGLKMVAQADVLDDTDGIDPTGLPRNNLFEDAISELYDVLRVEESIPSDEIAGARFTAFNILKG